MRHSNEYKWNYVCSIEMQWPFEYFIGLLALGPGELDEMAGSISKESCSRKSESCIIRLESKERQ